MVKGCGIEKHGIKSALAELENTDEFNSITLFQVEFDSLVFSYPEWI